MIKLKEFLGGEKAKGILNELIRPVAVLAVICITVSLLLGLTNFLTAKRITELASKAEREAMAALLEAKQYEEIDFSENAYYNPDAGFAFYIAKGEDGKEIGYLVTTAANGYGGEVKVMTAVSLDKKVFGVNILSVADETPGLGQNVTKEEFYKQFIGKSENIVAVKNSAIEDKNEINAVTGATVTSRAVTKSVNSALEAVKAYEKAEEDRAAQAVAGEIEDIPDGTGFEEVGN